MKTVAISIVFAALWLAPTHGHAGARELSGEFVVADGLEVTLWAESPLFFKPTNIDVDQRGRIWVAEGVNYRTFRGKDVNQPDAVSLRHPEGDRIMILEDTDGDGVADSSKVFVQDKDLVAPLGVAVIGNRVFVSCSPHLIAYMPPRSVTRCGRGTAFEGTDGWVLVSRGNLRTSPEALARALIEPKPVPRMKSGNHVRNFIDGVKSRGATICPIDEAVKADTLCHLGDLATRLERKLKWDPTKEQFVGDADANKRLEFRPMRKPWQFA